VTANFINITSERHLTLMFTIVFNKSVVDAASKKLSYRRGTARRAMSVEILTNAARTIVGKIAIEKACS